MRKEGELDTWRLLFRVAELGSVTRAAAEHGIEPSSVSRRLSALEKSLDCNLLVRSSRTISLSSVGRTACERLQPLIEEWESVIADISRKPNDADEEIRVSTAIGFGQEVLTPLVIKFNREHPEIRINLNFSDRPADLHQNEVDVVFRYGPIEDENLVARRMGTVDFPICASPAYLERHGKPEHPRDLIHHAVLFYSGHRRPATTHVFRAADSEPIAAARALRFNNVLAIREAAIAGGGIFVDVPLHSCAAALRSGELVCVLPEWRAPSIDAFAVRLASRRPQRQLTVFLDWISRQRARLRRQHLDLPALALK